MEYWMTVGAEGTYLVKSWEAGCKALVERFGPNLVQDGVFMQLGGAVLFSAYKGGRTLARFEPVRKSANVT